MKTHLEGSGDGEALSEMGLGLVEVALIAEQGAQVVVDDGHTLDVAHLLIQRQAALKERTALVPVAGQNRHHAQVTQGGGHAPGVAHLLA